MGAAVARLASGAMAVEASEWLSRFAAKLDTASPSNSEVEALLRLAGVAAHASERTAAPISCWLAAKAGVEPADAERAARQLAHELATGP